MIISPNTSIQKAQDLIGRRIYWRNPDRINGVFNGKIAGVFVNCDGKIIVSVNHLYEGGVEKNWLNWLNRPVLASLCCFTLWELMELRILELKKQILDLEKQVIVEKQKT